MNNYYIKIMRFIERKYRGEDRIMLIRYFQSDVFENDLRKFLDIQTNAGEYITETFATECLLESYKDRNDEEENVVLTPFEF